MSDATEKFLQRHADATKDNEISLARIRGFLELLDGAHNNRNANRVELRAARLAETMVNDLDLFNDEQVEGFALFALLAGLFPASTRLMLEDLQCNTTATD